MEHQQKLIFPKKLESNEIKNRLNEIKKMEEKNNRNDLKHEKK